MLIGLAEFGVREWLAEPTLRCRYRRLPPMLRPATRPPSGAEPAGRPPVEPRVDVEPPGERDADAEWPNVAGRLNPDSGTKLYP